MNILLIHKNNAFAEYLKDWLSQKKDCFVIVANILDVVSVFKGNKFLSEESVLILDAHITGNMSDCEGFNWINKLRLIHGIMIPIILLTWFSWPDHFKNKTYLCQHLDWFFMYSYERKKMHNPIIIKLPCIPEEIYQILLKI